MKTNTNFISHSSFAPTFLGLSVMVAGALLASALFVQTVEGWQTFMQPPTSVLGAGRATPEKPSVAPLTFTRRLDGVVVDTLAEADAVPVAVVIENMASTRPQSGLGKARVVYETLVEGGITRFLALFLPDAGIEKIGPVRSARHYFVDWAEEYGSPFVHAGGSPQGLSQIAHDQVPDVNGIGHAWQYFWRDRAVAAPHNLFTNSAQLQRAALEMHVPTQANFKAWAFVDGAPPNPGGRLTASVKIDLAGAAYDIRFDYDAATNTYGRFNGGQPHRDRGTDEQLHVENVIVQFVKPPTSLGANGRIDLTTEGDGRVVIFRNGSVQEGTWKKSGRAERTQWLNHDGSVLALNRGATWIVVVPHDRSVTWE